MIAAANALEVEHLEVHFGEKRILTDLSFEVGSGDALAIIGPNGAGKTVLFQALIGAIRYGGSIRWAPGTRLGYVPQKLDIERDLPLTGVDFLRAKASIARAPSGDVDRMLSLVGLTAAVAREPIGTLSGGQLQRLLLAFALGALPNVLLFDEPTAGVDQVGEEGLYETIHRLQTSRHDAAPHLARALHRLPVRLGGAVSGPRAAVLRLAPRSPHARGHGEGVWCARQVPSP
jgi:zinc transport system ATP-binding protein